MFDFKTENVRSLISTGVPPEDTLGERTALPQALHADSLLRLSGRREGEVMEGKMKIS